MEEILKKQIGKAYGFTLVVLFLVFVSFLVTVTGNAAKSSTSSQETRLIPMEDFFRNPEKTDFKLSPDGKHIAYLKPWQNRFQGAARLRTAAWSPPWPLASHHHPRAVGHQQDCRGWFARRVPPIKCFGPFVSSKLPCSQVCESRSSRQPPQTSSMPTREPNPAQGPCCGHLNCPRRCD